MSRPLGAVFVRWGTPRDPHPPALTLTTLVRRREKRIGLTSNYLDVTHTHPHTHNFVTHNSFTQTMSRTHSSFTHTHNIVTHTHISVAHNIVTKNFVTNTSFTHTHTLNSSYWKKMTWGVIGSFICVFFSYRESPNIHLLISRSEFFTDFSVAGMPPRPFLSPRTSMPQAIDHTMWGPPVISWFISPSNYSYKML